MGHPATFFQSTAFFATASWTPRPPRGFVPPTRPLRSKHKPLAADKRHRPAGHPRKRSPEGGSVVKLN